MSRVGPKYTPTTSICPHSVILAQRVGFLLMFLISSLITFNIVSRFLSFQSNIKVNNVKFDFSSASNYTSFPNIELCNYQSHSRQKVKSLYPAIKADDLRSLYAISSQHEQHANLEHLNIAQFVVDTAPIIKVLVCSIGELDCSRMWEPVITPMGVCLQLKLQDSETFRGMTLQLTIASQ